MISKRNEKSAPHHNEKSSPGITTSFVSRGRLPAILNLPPSTAETPTREDGYHCPTEPTDYGKFEHGYASIQGRLRHFFDHY